jgi:hypothetical protein
VRTGVAVSSKWIDAPVYLERVDSLPVAEIEVTERVREFHRASLIRSVYERRGSASEYTWPEAALGASYFHMAGLALEVLAPDRDFDLVVLVTATPDCQLTHFSGPRFNEALPGRPGFIGVGDQGVAGPFTALRIVRNHIRYGLVERAIVLVMEQAMLPVMPDHLRAPRDCAVAIVVSRRSGLRLAAESITRDGAARPRAVPDYQNAVLIQGSGITDLDFIAPKARFGEVWKPEGNYACTGVWETLATRLPSLRHGRVVLADVDQPLSYRCYLELIHTPPTQEEAVDG